MPSVGTVPMSLVGFVRPVLAMAQWITRTATTSTRSASIVTGAEALYEAERKEIESAFHCPVFNTYGCREFMLIAAECEQQAGLHINADHLVVEIVGPAGQAVTDASGDVVITDLHNLAMPLVRYHNGDQGDRNARWSLHLWPRPSFAAVRRWSDSRHDSDARWPPGARRVLCVLSCSEGRR